MIYLINPREEWWHGLAQLFSLAQVSEKDLNAPEFKKYIQTFNIQNHIEEWAFLRLKNVLVKKSLLQVDFQFLI